MCEFISWVKYNNKPYFLTYDLIHNTPRGDIIQKRFPGAGELVGHSAIRAYFELDERGINKECTDFSSPTNFPSEIATALTTGQFRGSITPNVLAILTTDALKEYAEREKAYAEWEKASAEREKADAELKKAYAELKKAYAELKKAYAVNNIFSEIIALPENRIEAWS